MSEQTEQKIYERPSRMPDADRSAFISQLDGLADDPSHDTGADQIETRQEEPAQQEPTSNDAPAVEPAPEIIADAAPGAADPLAETQAAEKRAKFDTERSTWLEEKQTFLKDFEAQKAALADRLTASESREADWQAKAARAKYDPGAVLAELGLKSSEEQMAAAKQLFDMAKAGEEGAAPELKATAERNMLAREHSDQLSAMRAEIQSLRESADSEKQAIAGRQVIDQYAAGLNSSVGDDTPLTRNLLRGKGKEQTTQRLLQVAAALREQSGEVPDAADVLKIYEESERAHLMERGIDPDLVAKAAAKTLTPEATRETATLSNDLSTTTPPRTEPLTRNEQKADVLKTLMSGNLG